MIRAIVFDFDGLMIDTETLEYEILQQMYGEYGLDLPIEAYAQNIGTRMEDGQFNPYTNLATLLDHSKNALFLEDVHKERFHEQVSRLVLRDGVLDFIAQAKQLQLKIALATSSNRAWIDRFFTQHDLHQHFDCICTSDDVANVKPDPELYLRALSLLGVAGDEAIAFEDSHNGSMAAVAAGMHCIAIPNSVTQHFKFEHCAFVISSMGDTSLQEIIEKIEAKR